MKTLMLSGIAALMLMLSAAHAQASWSSNGGGCVPEDPSIQSNLYSTVTGGMRVKFQSGQSGTIKLVCPVTTPDLQDVNMLEMYYQDPDGYGNAYHVTAALRSVRLSDGAYSTVCTARFALSGRLADRRLEPQDLPRVGTRRRSFSVLGRGANLSH